MNDSKLVGYLNDTIETKINTSINTLIKSSYILSRKAVIIKYVDADSDMISISFVSDNNTSSNYYYPNRTGRRVVAGEKVYLVYQTKNISQGWIEDISNLNTLRYKYRRRENTGTGTLNDADNEFGFAYTLATNGAGISGSYISFSGLSGTYQTQIMSSYQTHALAFRTQNGDSGDKKTWNTWRWIPTMDVGDVCKFGTNGTGLLGFDSATGNYIRTPVNGIVPNSNGVNGYVGTNDWRFIAGYFADLNVSSSISCRNLVASNVPLEVYSAEWDYCCKFPSGLAICQRIINITTTWVAWGNIFESAEYFRRALPVNLFTSPPNTLAGGCDYTSVGYMIQYVSGGSPTTATPYIYLARPNNPGRTTVNMTMTCIGRSA